MNKKRIIQKLIGLFFITIGILTPIFDNGDITAAVFFIPIGICLIATKQNYISFF